ncbi:MAG: GNAT family N-acetyltransferase [Nitrospiraceae bacterium]|nr:GNAT family N-acetyltransferase [Nitrospiraceae bacterium]
MEITLALSRDIPKLCELLDSLFAQEAEFLPDHRAQTRGLASVINGPEVGDIIVARKNGDIIGMVNLLYTISTAIGARVALLEDMVISPAMRGQGVGSRLIRRAIKFAKEKGCRRITLLTDNDNKRAHRFYKRQGFRRSSMVVFRMSLD